MEYIENKHDANAISHSCLHSTSSEAGMKNVHNHREFGGIWWYSENYFLSYSFSFLSVLLYEKI